MDELLSKVKANLILEHTADDELLKGYITAAVSYAESYQHIPEGFYKENPMPATTEQAVIMLSSHFYESRDGSTGGFFADNTGAAQQVWNTVNLLNGFADIVKTRQVKDSEGFIHSENEILASVRVYREGRHGSQRWANLAAFSEATDLFRFRCIPGLTITTDHFLICDGERFNIISVENVKGRGMYIEVLAKRSEPTIGKS